MGQDEGYYFAMLSGEEIVSWVSKVELCDYLLHKCMWGKRDEEEGKKRSWFLSVGKCGIDIEKLKLRYCSYEIEILKLRN